PLIPKSITPSMEPGQNRRVILGKLVPGQVRFVVAVVVALNIGRVRAVRLMYDGIDDQPGNQGTIGIGTDHRFIDDLLHYDDDVLGGKRYFLLHAEQTPQLRVPLRIGALRVEDGDIGIERRYHRDLAGAGRIVT